MARILSVDIAKGIAIVLVILAHTFSSYERNDIREVIYSFHMPLFFILSGYTSRYSANKYEVVQRTNHLIKKLVPPVLLLWFIFGINSYLNKIDAYTSIADFIIQKLLQLIYASGITCSQLVILGGGNIEALGIPWFFVTLIGATIIYDTIQLFINNRYNLFLVVCILSGIGVFIGQLYYLPFCFDASLAVVFFLWVGQQINKLSISFDVKKFSIALIFWGILCFIINRYANWGLEIAGRSYPLFPLSFICAVCGTLVVIYLSDLISQNESFIISHLALWGRYSLILLLVHCVDFLWKEFYTISDHIWVNAPLRIVIDLAVLYLYIRTKALYNRLNLHKKNYEE